MNPAALALALCFTDFPISDADYNLFPLDETVRRQYHDSTRYRASLEVERDRGGIDPGFWEDWIDLSWHSCRSWKYLHLATTPETWDKETNNHCYLLMLREEIGMVAYYRGEMPPTRPFAPRLFER